MNKIMLEEAMVRGMPAVCIVGIIGTDAVRKCEEIRKAIMSPNKEVDFKYEATGIRAILGSDEYRIISRTITSIECMQQLIKSGTILIEPFNRQSFSGFSITPAE